MKKIKAWIRSILLSNAGPKEISEALALGVFIAFIPIIGIHTWLALGLAFLLKKNKVAVLVGVYVSNPITVLPILYACFELGQWMLGYDEPIGFHKDLFLNPYALGEKILVPLWAGSLVAGIVSTIATYYGTRFLYNRFADKIAAYRHAHHHPPA